MKAGDQIPADAKVVDGGVRVNESLLTGESDEIAKEVGDELLSGSFVVSGEVMAQLVKVGSESYIAKLTAEAKAMGGGEESKMIRAINRLIKWVGIIIIPMGLALFAQAYFLNHRSFAESISSMEAAIIGMIPEGLYLLTTVALALAAMRLARNQVMLHDMKSVETWPGSMSSALIRQGRLLSRRWRWKKSSRPKITREMIWKTGLPPTFPTCLSTISPLKP